MRHVFLTCLAGILAAGVSFTAAPKAEAGQSGCIQFDVLPGSHNWKFRNRCNSRVEVAYCVRYFGDSSTRYISRFQFNPGASLTVYLQNRQNRLRFNYQETRYGGVVPPGC